MIISIHIPKTAGTSLVQTLRMAYDDDILYDYSDQYTFIDIYKPSLIAQGWRLMRKVKQRRLRHKPRITDKCIHGHFRAAKYLDIYPDAKMIAWVRDPVERVMSHYYFWQRSPDYSHSVCRYMIKNHLSLVEFARLEPMRNIQYKYLSGIPVDKFWFIGVTEYFDAMLPILCEKLDIVPHNATVNVNPDKRGRTGYDIDVGIKEEIRILNRLDNELYSDVVGRLSEYDLTIDSI